MPITGPNRPSGEAPLNISNHIMFNGFIFKPKQVEAVSHKEMADGLRTTTLVFQSHKETVQDPDGELFNYFVKRFHPNGVKEEGTYTT